MTADQPKTLSSYEEALLLLDFPTEQLEIPSSEPVRSLKEQLQFNSYPKSNKILAGKEAARKDQEELYMAANLLLGGSLATPKAKDLEADHAFKSQPAVLVGNQYGENQPDFNSNSIVIKKPKKRKSLAGLMQTNRSCDYCQATETPMWRHGPVGYADLCNKCGVKWMRGRILRDVALHASVAKLQ